MSSLFADEGWSPAGALHLDFTGLQGTACYLDAEAEKIISDAMADLPLRAIHWIDSGDYHYLTALWLRKLTRPATLVLFDNHPDDQPPAFGEEMLSCGGWVSHSRRENPFLREDADEVYLSIDLDLLGRDYARTDWDQGEWTLEDLLAAVSRTLDGKILAGVDICGGLTEAKGGTAEDYAVNRRTRQVLHDYFKAF